MYPISKSHKLRHFESAMAPSPDPETVQWVYDYIPHYRFNPDIITDFLKNKWRDYDEFFVEVSGWH